MGVFVDTEKRKIQTKLNEQTKESLKRAIDYISDKKKTKFNLVSGYNCSSNNVYKQMMITKKMYAKTNGRQFKHFVHSFHFKENISPELAHEISMKLLNHKKFKGFQIFAVTHIDKEHIHTHYIVNSVNLETGKKWSHSAKDINNIRKYSNQLCYEYGLKWSFTERQYKKSQSISNSEYRAKKGGRSWKHELLLTIDKCMKISTNKEEFISNMKMLGYKVKWQKNRKYITFTLPSGQKCRNSRLHPPNKFTKQALTKRFQLNKQLQEISVKFKLEKKVENLQNLILETIKVLRDNPQLGNKSYPLTYLEGQALKEKMIEQTKGKGLSWDKEIER